MVNVGRVEHVGLCLGCNHKTYNAVSPYTGKPTRAMEYEMSEFLCSCVEVYQKLAGVKQMRKASAPSCADSPGESPGHPYDRINTDEGRVQFEGRPLSSDASKVLTKVFYTARMARYDLLRCVGALASFVTKWDPSRI